jgi:hypothetical protein
MYGTVISKHRSNANPVSHLAIRSSAFSEAVGLVKVAMYTLCERSPFFGRSFWPGVYYCANWRTGKQLGMSDLRI